MSNSMTFAFYNNHAGYIINNIMEKVRLDVGDQIGSCNSNR